MREREREEGRERERGRRKGKIPLLISTNDWNEQI
jgi:hypothetical protein